MAEQIHKLNVGDLFDNRYELKKIIGVGGFAEVWRAVDVVTNVTKAIKVYTSLDDEAFRELAAEYACMEGINHPGLIHADHFDRCGNIPYLTMKFCAGGSLLHNVGHTNTEQLLDIIHDIADALAYLHENNMVHQDIKPANILVDFRGDKVTYLLSDFGISSKSRNHLTKSMRLNGKDNTVAMTEAYAPPEKFSPKRVDRLPDPKGDIFSLGLTIYELATGHLPFNNLSTGRELFYNGVTIDLKDVQDPVIRCFIERCISTDRDVRPAARDLIPMLEQLSKNPPKDASGEPRDSRQTVIVTPQQPRRQVNARDDHQARGTKRITTPKGGGGWFSSLTRGMKLTIYGIVAFVVVIAVMSVASRCAGGATVAGAPGADTPEPLSREFVKDDDLKPLPFETTGINHHYVEVLTRTDNMQKRVRSIITSTPSYRDMAEEDRALVKDFIRSYYYLSNNEINSAYPAEDAGDDMVKNPHVTNKIRALEIVYENIRRKYSADWAEINRR